MLRNLLFLIVLSLSGTAVSQTIYETFNSRRLGVDRQLKIQLPRNYDSNSKKEYPLIIVLDGDYLFEPMAGNVDLYAYWEEIPEAIVVGVNQLETRRDDTFNGDERSLPTKSGADFFEFLGMELLPHLDKKYRTANFAALAGHDITANFINYYMFKGKPLFQAYINLSPELAPQMSNRLVQAFSRTTTPKWFYLATSSGDVKSLRNDVTNLHAQLQTIENSNFHYSFDYFDGPSHFGLVGAAIPKALQSIFSEFRPISVEEYETSLMASETAPLEYLKTKYEKIENYYDVKMRIRISDFLAVGKALEYREDWDNLEKLGGLALKQYPDATMGVYYQARANEAFGKTDKAIKLYQNAYGKEEIAFMTIDFMFARAESIKKDLASNTQEQRRP